ncbi:MAG: exodeoxyribonuclease VII large subunit [Verrucomicrobiales bacterium]|nr:exodeoxyribonuclease VII large subunit [Verrucomicrobiales bacterium]
MSKPLKSQWNFGELFPPEVTRRVFTVTELTVTVRRLIENHVGRLWVGGEITNFRLQTSGHSYFSVKDSGAQLNCVLFRDEARSISRDLLRDGQKVVLQGEMTVYEARGQYQLRVTAVELQGVGALQAAFERLKQKLNAEGLFAPERKRPLPRFPQRIGLVTSPTGAAIRDVLHAIERRQPGLEIVLSACRVQGQGAGAEVACAIRLLNEWNDLVGRDPKQKIDLILVTRGGGSLEDLWAFNEEIVARAIFESKLPVVSAVGHEIDFTISDFVADLRAATPSAAGEIITEGAFASRSFVDQAKERLRYLALRILSDARDNLMGFTKRLGRVHPRRRLQEQAQRLDDLQATLARCARFGLRNHGAKAATLTQRLLRLRPSLKLGQGRKELARLERLLTEKTHARLGHAGARLANAATRLRLLSPLNVLERGYSLTLDAGSGKAIQSASQISAGQRLRTKLRQGEIISIVERAEDIVSGGETSSSRKRDQGRLADSPSGGTDSR